MSELKDKLFDVMSNIFGCDTSELNMESIPSSVSGWDSMAHVLLIGEIEREFGISLTTNELAKMVSVKSIIEIVKQKRGF